MVRACITRKLATAALLAAAFTASAAQTAWADELRIDEPQAAPQDMPARGMTMDRVQSRFGAPHNKLAAVGDPPITRWEYPGYIVYFEHQHVIHSVTKHPLT